MTEVFSNEKVHPYSVISLRVWLWVMCQSDDGLRLGLAVVRAPWYEVRSSMPCFISTYEPRHCHCAQRSRERTAHSRPCRQSIDERWMMIIITSLLAAKFNLYQDEIEF